MIDLTKISTKGQVVIPNEIRKKLNIDPGDTLQIEEVNGLIVLKRIELSSLKNELGGKK